MSTYAEKLEAAHEERKAILARIAEAFTAMQLDAAPSMTPFASESSAPALTAAISTFNETGDQDVLDRALTDALSPEGTDYSDDMTPMVVLSLNGLRRIEALMTELQQRREQAEAE